MTEINRVLKRAAWRLGVVNFLRGWVYAAAVILAGAIVLRVVEQLLSFTQTAATRVPAAMAEKGAGAGITSAEMWNQVAWWGAGASVVFALAWAIARRPRRNAVARRVDEGANLRESLSTALCVSGKDDPWSRATVESATRTARGVNVSQAVPISPPRFWPVVVALGLSLAVVFIAVPRMDVFGWFARAVAQKEQRVEVINATREVKEVQKKIEEMTAKIPSLEKEKALESAAAEKPEPKTAEEIRKAAINDLTKLSDRLEQLKSGAQAQKLDAVQRQLKNLKTSQDDNELSKALAKGDFGQAKQELEKMKDQLASGSMSEETKEKVSEQMEKMAEQLANLAKNQDQMKKALEQAGINPDSIKDPKSAKEAIKNASNLTQEQKKTMQDMVDAAMQSSEMMQQMSSAMQKMSECNKPGDGQSQSQQGAKQLGDQLSEMEQIQQEMELADASMSECQNAMNSLGKEGEGECQGMGECKGGLGGSKDGGREGTKPWSAGTQMSNGMGRGGPGLGQGGRPGEAKADFDLDRKKDIGAKGNGPIVSSRLVEGESIKGESKAAFAKAVAAADQGATEAIEKNTIPREYQEAIKSYFGRLKSKVKAAEGDKADNKADEPAAAPAKDGGKE